MKKSFLLAAVLFLSVAPTALYAQDIQTKGSLSGTIVDHTGAVIREVKITVTGQKTIDRVMATNDDGVFEVQNLTPGIYRLKAEQTNVTNGRKVRLPNQFRESTAGQLNPASCSLNCSTSPLACDSV